MKDLSRHIEYLLCEHNSVAIPGIGVFVTKDLPARYYTEENLYLPPVRSVNLDTSRTDDDGKLENCLIQLHHVTRNVARKWIEDYIDGINQSLMDMGMVDMGTIGRLVVLNNKISFEVCDAGINTPELYGLDSFHMTKLPAHAFKSHDIKDSTHLTISLRRTTVHRIMAAAAMIVVALTVVLPNYSSFNYDRMQARLASTETLLTLFNITGQTVAEQQGQNKITEHVDNGKPGSENTTDVNPKNTINETSVTDTETITADTASVKTDTKSIQSSLVPEPYYSTETENIPDDNVASKVEGYCVVMASAITHKGAERLISKLNNEGFHNAVKLSDRGMLRVVLAGYDNQEAARADLAKVRNTDKLYSGSWIKVF